ncbi:MAG: PilT/PilU family type 4a pilus ATPase [Armatimonadetes bacterium]|nr:PilT/PilU family type 4a pilus ATPase [Armatimonadota bacterium]MDE2206937.1 PilT/PilU family type 4a pilus ATPase [Armatimonadota bacterium]
MQTDSNNSANVQSPTLLELIAQAASMGASDLFLKAGSPPGFKCYGKISKSEGAALTPEQTRALAEEQMSHAQQQRFAEHLEMNLSFTVPGVARIRQNCYFERDSVATTCRLVPLTVRTLDEVGIPVEAVSRLTEYRDGLVLVTGPTGSGKSTTLAAMIEHINRHFAVNIITLEDPIEYVYQDKLAMISQREVGVDTHSYEEALKQVLRQTPNVILMGEVRDQRTLDVALQASETGHLVFGTLHTAGACETIERVANLYPPAERPLLWQRLSVSLRGVISQKLLPCLSGHALAAALEMLVVNPTIEHLLADGQHGDLYGMMRQDGEDGYWGMRTMNQALLQLVMENTVSEGEAISRSSNVAELKQMLRKLQLSRSRTEPGTDEESQVPEPTIGVASHQRGGESMLEQGQQPEFGAAPVEESMFVLRRSP